MICEQFFYLDEVKNLGHNIFPCGFLTSVKSYHNVLSVKLIIYWFKKCLNMFKFCGHANLYDVFSSIDKLEFPLLCFEYCIRQSNFNEFTNRIIITL